MKKLFKLCTSCQCLVHRLIGFLNCPSCGFPLDTYDRKSSIQNHKDARYYNVDTTNIEVVEGEDYLLIDLKTLTPYQLSKIKENKL